MHCTSLYCPVLHCSSLYFTALYYSALHCTEQYCTELYCTVYTICTVLHCKDCTALYGLYSTGLLVCVEISYLWLSLSSANEWDRGVEICRQDNTLLGNQRVARYPRGGQVSKGWPGIQGVVRYPWGGLVSKGVPGVQWGPDIKRVARYPRDGQVSKGWPGI